MRVTIIAKSAAGFETHFELDADPRLTSYEDIATDIRDLEQVLARRGYTPTHPRPARDDGDPMHRIRARYRGYSQQ